MARPVRIEFPGAIYHVCNRMIGSWQRSHERLFRDERDYHRFLQRLAENVETFGIRLYLFTLMSNHFHLVMETPEANLGKFMQTLATAYTVYFNQRHRRHGHLLDGRYKAKLVSGDAYLLKLSRYLHLNPVFVGGWVRRSMQERLAQLRTYKWSSYAGYVGLRPPWEFVDDGPVLAMMGAGPSVNRKRYKEFVQTGLATGDAEFEEALRASPSGIGDETFLKWVEFARGRNLKKRGKKEDVAFRRVIEPLAPDTVLQVVAEVLGVELEELRQRRKGSLSRAVAGRCLIRYAGQTQREAATRLGLGTGAAVSAQLKRLPRLIRENPRLQRQLNRIEKRLDVQKRIEAGNEDG